MDVVHHAGIGAAGFLALEAQGHEIAGLAFLAGSVLPDIDAAFIAGGKRFYLRQHQGPTHSVFLAPLSAAALAGAFALPLRWNWGVFLAALTGIALHVGLDLLNTFGVRILWPFSARRVCLDAVFFIDAVAWALTLAFFCVVLSGAVTVGVAGPSYAGLLAAYLLAKFVLQRSVKARVEAAFAIPSALNPFVFFLLAVRGQRWATARYNAVTRSAPAWQAVPEIPSEVVALSEQSNVYRDMRSILRSLHIISVTRDDAGTSVIAEDLAVRNFGGRFGRTELRFDAVGRLTHEMAHI